MSASPAQNTARVYAFAKTCKPFQPSVDGGIVVAVAVTVAEPVSVTDNVLGEGSYSIQFQSNCKNGQWAQGLFQFLNKPGNPGVAIFQLYEAKGSTQEQVLTYSSDDAGNPLPKIDGLGAGYTYTIQIKSSTANQTTSLFASIQDPSGKIVWQTLADVPFLYYGEPIDANAVACGYGGYSSAKFASGRFRFQILSFEDDLGFVQPNPWFHVDYTTPCGNPILTLTGENDNLAYINVASTGSGVSCEAVPNA